MQLFELSLWHDHHQLFGEVPAQYTLLSLRVAWNATTVSLCMTHDHGQAMTVTESLRYPVTATVVTFGVSREAPSP
jgi:hypothetical protein